VSLPHLDHMRQVIESLPHCKKLGLKITQLEQGKGAIQLEPRSELIGNTARNLLHSGVVTTLLDTLCGIVASSAYAEGRTVATLDLRLDHLQNLDASQMLYGKAECYHCNEDVAYVRGWAWQEDEAAPVAYCVGTFMTSGIFKLKGA
jgi:uncharacterized protein (TIGR00369 family)